MAVAERQLRARFGADLVDHHTYCIVGDGDLSEGLSHESASLAGHLGLGRLVCIYDDNHVSIDGPTELSLSDDAAERFAAYGWHVQDLGEAAEDLDAIEAALLAAVAEDGRPSLVILRSHIAYPSPTKTDDAAAHGYALKDADITAAKAVMGLPDEPFFVPGDVVDVYRGAGARGRDEREAWQKRLEAYDGDRATFDAVLESGGLAGWTDALPTWEPGEQVATRVASGKVLQAARRRRAGPAGRRRRPHVQHRHGAQGPRRAVPRRARRSSALLRHPGARHGRRHERDGAPRRRAARRRHLPGVQRLLPAVGAARGASVAAKVIYSFTHDSVGVGEDGPTHQPVEHIAALRAIPGLRVIRPADANETAEAWRLAVEHDGPTALILSRQDLPVLEGTAGADLSRGGHVLRPAEDADIVLVSTGSEVHVALAAAELLAAEGIHAQVTSLPCWDLFAAQSDEVQDAILPAEVPTLSVEAGVSFGWERWADDSVAIDRFGASAPGDRVLAELGFTADHVAARARQLIHELEEPA